jgi:hypothetical protein
VNGHRPIIDRGLFGARASCECGWRGALHRIVRGWMPGARDVEQNDAVVEWKRHVQEAVR